MMPLFDFFPVRWSVMPRSTRDCLGDHRSILSGSSTDIPGLQDGRPIKFPNRDALIRTIMWRNHFCAPHAKVVFAGRAGGIGEPREPVFGVVGGVGCALRSEAPSVVVVDGMVSDGLSVALPQEGQVTCCVGSKADVRPACIPQRCARLRCNHAECHVRRTERWPYRGLRLPCCLTDGSQVGSLHRVDANGVSVAVDELDFVDRRVSIMDVDDLPLCFRLAGGPDRSRCLRITLSCSLNMGRFPWGRYFFAGIAGGRSLRRRRAF